jgi:hypothetical protein
MSVRNARQFDEGFVGWKVDYERSGGAFIDSDWDDAFFRWTVMDGEQKAAVMRNTRERCTLAAWPDPSMVKRPQNYLDLKKKEWTRPVIAPRKTAFEQLMEMPDE